MRRALIGTLVILAFAAAPAAAQEVSVHGAWARETAAGAANGAAYLTVDNLGDDDLMRDARSAVAGAVEIHSHVMEDSVMRMRRLEGVPVPAGSTVTFKPGGLHIMLIGLNQPLRAGDVFALTLLFDKAGPVTVDVAVRALSDHGVQH